MKFRGPARLGDALVVESRCIGVGGATATIQQRVMRADVILTEATVIAAFLTPAGRPRRQPKPWVEIFERLMSNA